MSFNGLSMSLGNLSKLSNAKSFSISAENPTGEKGKGSMSMPSADSPSRELGQGWKCKAYQPIGPKQTIEIANIDGSGAIQSMWMAAFTNRETIIRIYWDHQEWPSVEAPLSDFFAIPWTKIEDSTTVGHLSTINSLPICVNPNRGCNCYFEMPFRKHCRITIENISETRAYPMFYQINYTLTDEIDEDCAYFHARFNRKNPLGYLEPYTILEGVQGKGQYIGVSMGWGINNCGWWGEGEIKFYIDGDKEFPTICGTGTEDYFGGAYNWENNGKYIEYSTPFLGMHYIKPDGLYNSQQRHSLYRWHVMDPVRFETDIKVTIDSLGWRSDGRFYPGQHDICSVAYWYQTLPTVQYPTLLDKNHLEIV